MEANYPDIYRSNPVKIGTPKILWYEHSWNEQISTMFRPFKTGNWWGFMDVSQKAQIEDYKHNA